MTSETAEKDAEKKKNDAGATADAIVTTTKEIGEKLQKLSKPLFEFLCAFLPILIELGQKFHGVWIKLDNSIVKSIIGFVFCFFGGFYPTLFAAVQAAEQSGRALVVESMYELADETTRIIDESKKDEDQNPDLKKLTNKEYMKRKTLFVLQKMKPEKVNNAIRNIYTVWLGVISVLVVQFAQTIQMANSIAEFLLPPADHYVTPIVRAAIPDEYQQWTPVIINWACKTVGMTFAWTLASIRIAFASSMQGGLMLAQNGKEALRKRDIRLGVKFDEYLAYGLAAVGFFFQLRCGLNPPFPLNIVLFPFKIGEWVLRYGVMKASGVAAA